MHGMKLAQPGRYIKMRLLEYNSVHVMQCNFSLKNTFIGLLFVAFVHCLIGNIYCKATMFLKELPFNADECKKIAWKANVGR